MTLKAPKFNYGYYHIYFVHWQDTSGRERFITITSSYWRGCHGVLFVYDVTVPVSFQSLLAYKRDFDKYSPPQAPIMLIGNKSDLERQVATDEAQVGTTKRS